MARGRRPGVLYFNNDPKDFETLDPEIIYSYEAGVKGSILEGRLNYDFCAYYYDWYNYQTSVFNATTSKFEYDDAGLPTVSVWRQASATLHAATSISSATGRTSKASSTKRMTTETHSSMPATASALLQRTVSPSVST